MSSMFLAPTTRLVTFAQVQENFVAMRGDVRGQASRVECSLHRLRIAKEILVHIAQTQVASTAKVNNVRVRRFNWIPRSYCPKLDGTQNGSEGDFRCS